MDYNKNIVVQLNKSFSLLINKLWSYTPSTDIVILSQLIRPVHDTGISTTTIRTHISGELNFLYFK